ncbi:MAG: LysM peptidoglycan-binding domain-containing protein [Thermoanaerobaculales bacterium]|nr:LysM peptidoglycan-binding domain-containing protein [Thermoanaerobaculales bacterium]
MLKIEKIPVLSLALVVLVTLLPTGCKTIEPPPPPPIEALPPEPEPTPEPPAEESAESSEIVETETTEEADAETFDPEALQQQALDLCQSATEFLDQGDVDDALAALDHAYELMLQLPNNGDETYLQAREDIRRLVADLIVSTYDSQKAAMAPMTSLDLEITLVNNDHVKREIKSFTNGERQVFIDAYRRSGLYRQMMLEKLEAAGLPSQLSWLPLVESNFKVKAYSRASAVGLWQFISSTGQRYGLSRDAWVDERMDPEKSTDGAIAYLTELHDMFGDWPKALAAYNCGEGRVARLQRRSPSEYLDFWDLYNLLPRETRRYVPRLFATLMIVEDPASYGIELPEPAPPLPEWQTVNINRTVKLENLDKSLDLAPGTLKELNPELRHSATPKHSYDLKVPVGRETALLASINTVPEWNPPTPAYSTHRVRRGETLSRIAQRYGTSINAIMRSNNLRSAHRIYPGQRLKVPVRGSSVPSGPSFNPAEGTHTVRRGESLYSIARCYSTTVDRIRRDNNLSSNTIHPGKKLKVAAGSRTDLKRHTVRRGDTASGIAKTYGVSLSTLLRANGLSSRSTIYPGQVLVVP